jgi:hypothetical protein
MVHAGVSSDGDHLIVATVRLTPDPAKAWCEPHETWLVKSGPAGVHRVHMLASHCVSPSVARESVVLAGPNVIRYSASNEGRKDLTGFRASTLEIALEPLQLLRREVRTWGTHDLLEPCNGEDEYWDWRTYSGETRLFATRGNRCSGAREPILPHADLTDEAAFVRDGWRHVRLGDCSMRVSGASASLRALYAGDERLFIEVTDDHFVSSGAATDRLVLEWPNPEVGPRKMHVALDGRTDSRSLDVRVAVADANTRRFRIGTYEPEIRITYEDSDDGKTIAERISSATDDGYSVGQRIDGAVCAAREGVLQVDRKLVVEPPTEAIFED